MSHHEDFICCLSCKYWLDARPIKEHKLEEDEGICIRYPDYKRKLLYFVCGEHPRFKEITMPLAEYVQKVGQACG